MTDYEIIVFMTTVHSGSYSATARELYISRQSVSKYIRELEEELHTELFERGRRPLELTESGRRSYLLFERYRNNLQQTKEALLQWQWEKENCITVGICSWLDVTKELRDSLILFRRLHPGCRVAVRVFSNAALLEKLEDGSLDLIVTTADWYIQKVEFEYMTIALEEMCLYAPARLAGDSIDKALWNLPVLQRKSWDWSYLEWKSIGDALQSRLSFKVKDVQVISNTDTLVNRARRLDSVVISDRHFGYMRGIPGLKCFPLGLSSHISCVWKRNDENKLILPLAQHLRSILLESVQ